MATCQMTKEQAIAALKRCSNCSRWQCYETCDHCWVDRHTCPPTLPQAIETLQRAARVGREAEQMIAALKKQIGTELQGLVR